MSKLSEKLSYFNTWSGKGFHKDMQTYALIKFGANENKWKWDGWKITTDDYANQLLDCFAGVTTSYYGSVNLRIFLRVIIAIELGNYLLFDKKEEGLLERYKLLDKYFWSKGAGYSEQTLKLTYNPLN